MCYFAKFDFIDRELGSVVHLEGHFYEFGDLIEFLASMSDDYSIQTMVCYPKSIEIFPEVDENELS